MGGERDTPSKKKAAEGSVVIACGDFGDDELRVSKEESSDDFVFLSKDSPMIARGDQAVVAENTAAARGVAPFTPGAFSAVGASLSVSVSSSSSLPSKSRRARPLAPPVFVAFSGAEGGRNDGEGDGREGVPLPAADMSAVGYACACEWWRVAREQAKCAREKASILKDQTMEAFMRTQRCVRHRWEQRGPPPPALKRFTEYRMFLVLIGVLMSIIVVLPAYWAMPSDGGQRRMTAREWQARYSELQQRYEMQSQVAKEYRKLGAKHTALQEEHDALLNFVSIKEKRAHERMSGGGTYGANCRGNGAGGGHCKDDMMGTWGGKEGVQGPVQAVKDSLMAAEKSAYEMYKHFSDGLKEDVQELKDRFYHRTRFIWDSRKR